MNTMKSVFSKLADLQQEDKTELQKIFINPDPITDEMVKNLIPIQLKEIQQLVGEEKFAKGNYNKAAELFETLVLSEQFEEFLTLPAYNYFK